MDNPIPFTMQQLFPVFLILLFGASLQAQSNPFHTLNMPVASTPVTETQKVGVTYITIDYHSPVLQGRDVWNDERVVPKNGDPYPWRAGANMNTTMAFSTDVLINGEPLPAGKYGFHIIPKGDNQYTLLFAHANHQWGSYYLDIARDVTLQVSVAGRECPLSENLDYEFEHREEGQVDIALHWGTKSIPFTVSVDLNETVVSSLRQELRGVNTYHWQAWNDAARWCYEHDTNLEEALEWVNHSINGGFGGFAADKNASNLMTKILIADKLGREAVYDETIREMVELDIHPGEANSVSQYLLRIGKLDEAIELLTNTLAENEEAWYLYLNRATAYYGQKNQQKMKADLAKAKETVPDNYRQMLESFEKRLLDGSYKLGS